MVNQLVLKRKLYVKKTEKASFSSSSITTEPSSYFKGKALVHRGKDSWVLNFSKTPSSIPSSFKVPFSISLKEGQALEAILRQGQGKWKLEIPYSQIYKDLIPIKKIELTKDENLLKKMNLPLEGEVAKILNRFLSSSLWSRHWLAMASLDKREFQDLSFLNLFSFLSQEEVALSDLEDLVSKPFKSSKGSSFSWQVIICEIEWIKGIRRATLNLCFSDSDIIVAWFLVFPLKEDFLIFKIQNSSKAFLFLPLSWKKYLNELLFKLSECFPNIKLEIIFKESVKESIDPWEEDFLLNE